MYTYKIHIFIDAYDIIIEYDNDIIHISNSLIKQLKISIILLITFL